jgi:hypothetical protein
MLKIKLKKNLAAPDLARGFHEHDIAHVPSDIPLAMARQLVKDGAAVWVDCEPPAAEKPPVKQQTLYQPKPEEYLGGAKHE